jgi:hypothetical protein
MTHIDIVFDGPPGPESGRFVEVEDAFGNSIRFGEWVQRPDGFWVLRIPASRSQIAALPELLEVARDIAHPVNVLPIWLEPRSARARAVLRKAEF